MKFACGWWTEQHRCASSAAADNCRCCICVPSNVGSVSFFANALIIKRNYYAASVATVHLLPPARVVLGLEPLLELFLESWLLLSLAQLPQPCISSESAHTQGSCYACNLVVASPGLKISSRSKAFGRTTKLLLWLGQSELQLLAIIELATFHVRLV